LVGCVAEGVGVGLAPRARVSSGAERPLVSPNDDGTDRAIALDVVTGGGEILGHPDRERVPHRRVADRQDDAVAVPLHADGGCHRIAPPCVVMAVAPGGAGPGPGARRMKKSRASADRPPSTRRKGFISNSIRRSPSAAPSWLSWAMARAAGRRS